MSSLTRPSRPSRPERFDAFKLTERRGTVAGTIDPYDLERVQESLGDEDGEIPESTVAFRIEGDVDDLGRPLLNVVLDGELPLQCQGCLGLFRWPVHQRTSVLLARDEPELSYLDENDEREVVLADAPLDPLQVVEDELLLSLPYVPRCERPDCLEQARGHMQDPLEGRSAFQSLQELKRSGSDPKS